MVIKLSISLKAFNIQLKHEKSQKLILGRYDWKNFIYLLKIVEMYKFLCYKNLI